jgi:hypothetical protein
VSEVAYATALVLAALFAWAGAAKLADRPRTAATFRAFGVPRPGWVGVGLPVVELGLAAALVVLPRVGGAVAVALLAAFTAVLARAVRRGVEVGCACFGTARAEPVSSVEVARNLLWAGAGGVALFAPAPDAPGLDSIVLVGTAVAVAAVALALIDLGRRTGHILRVDLSPGPGETGLTNGSPA